MNTLILREQHDALLEIAREMLEATACPKTPRPVSALRWRLARVLMAHLALEDQYLYPAMIASSNTRAEQMASKFQNETGALAVLFNEYLARWTDEKIGSDWPGFCSATRDILTKLTLRIERENTLLYPLVPSHWTAGAAIRKAG